MLGPNETPMARGLVTTEVRAGTLAREFPRQGHLHPPAFQEELDDRDSGQRASSITDSM